MTSRLHLSPNLISSVFTTSDVFQMRDRFHMVRTNAYVFGVVRAVALATKMIELKSFRHGAVFKLPHIDGGAATSTFAPNGAALRNPTRSFISGIYNFIIQNLARPVMWKVSHWLAFHPSVLSGGTGRDSSLLTTAAMAVAVGDV